MGDYGRESVATYKIGGHKFYVEGFWSPETLLNDFDGYDVFDDKNNCLNEGDPYYHKPSKKEVSLLSGSLDGGDPFEFKRIRRRKRAKVRRVR